MTKKKNDIKSDIKKIDRMICETEATIKEADLMLFMFVVVIPSTFITLCIILYFFK